MTPERWKQIESVFDEAVELPPGRREAYLAEACGGDAELRREVELLLSSHEEAGEFIEEPAVANVLSGGVKFDVEEEAPFVGRRVGSYRIVRELGRGGMGAVYLAVRADDEFQKRVAIKLVKRGMDTDFIVRRFRQERQILASLEHQNIARLLDGGTTEDGLPYFVMEYIEGLPINQFSDAHKLSTPERLRLFLKVCAAVAYAHHNLVIHRDLKPSNVMVMADGTPKLLDFGIAKLLNPEMGARTLDPTTLAMRMMTPEYASPEQVRGETVTMVSDVYSLGVLLYDLLTGHRPYTFRSRDPEEVARIICEQEPERPSVAVNLIEVIPAWGRDPVEITPDSVSRVRDGSLEKLRRQLSGSIDNIVLKALRKEPQRRYQSVEEFARDIEHYLSGRPVSAPAYFPITAETRVEEGERVTGSTSIAVLPFKTLSHEENRDEFLGMGMADAIITKLSNVGGIVVRPTSSVIKYFDGEQNVAHAGRELEVSHVLDGRIQRVGERVRVTVQLVRTRDSAPLWAGKFDEKFTDFFAVEDSLSEQVVRALLPLLTGDDSAGHERAGSAGRERAG
ncbi:MAG TPA: serine/threonine-protein kinase, partial [Pyrinomonadaceae bacterium]|nr:serine/threonine-protein kinase [Pyrinomonadaceae bacterium]